MIEARQLALAGIFDDLDTSPEQRTISERFWEFHRAHPAVYQHLRRFALEAKARGRERLGIKAIWERLRWYVAVEARDVDGFKLNNNYTSRYARLLMRQERDLEGFFETRELRAA